MNRFAITFLLFLAGSIVPPVLQAQSHVEGDIVHQSLAIEQGAYFEGKSRRSDNPLAEIKAPGTNGSANLGSHSASSPSGATPAAGRNIRRISSA